jgi:hypothetical protein
MKISRANKERHARLYAGHPRLSILAIVEDVDGIRNSDLTGSRKFSHCRNSGIPDLH